MPFYDRLRPSAANENNTTYAPVSSDEIEPKTTDETAGLYNNYQLLQRQVKSLKRWLIALACMLALCLGLLLFASRDTISYIANRPASAQESGKVLSPVPEMPVTTVIFERDDLYAGPSSQASDEAWTALQPIGDGFVVINDSQRYSLQPGKQTKKGEVYDISMFHQLHCLTMIRTYLWTLKFSTGRNNTQEIQELLLDPQSDHMYHCFDYIRQAIMCAGDMTVEWPREEPDGRRFAVDGWGVPHQCKSWDAIMDYMETNHPLNALGAVNHVAPPSR